jgi:hypothetical protein
MSEKLDSLLADFAKANLLLGAVKQQERRGNVKVEHNADALLAKAETAIHDLFAELQQRPTRDELMKFGRRVALQQRDLGGRYLTEAVLSWMDIDAIIAEQQNREPPK